MTIITSTKLAEVKRHFKHKYGYIKNERSGVESNPYLVKDSQQYIKLNPGCLFIQQTPKKEKGSRCRFI